MECANELVNLRAPHGALPPLGLNVDCIQAETVFFDNSVNAAIAALADALASVTTRPAITHLHKKFNDKRLEETWRARENAAKNFLSQTLSDVLMRKLKYFFWCFVCCVTNGFLLLIIAASRCFPKGDE